MANMNSADKLNAAREIVAKHKSMKMYRAGKSTNVYVQNPRKCKEAETELKAAGFRQCSENARNHAGEWYANFPDLPELAFDGIASKTKFDKFAKAKTTKKAKTTA